MAYVDFLSHNHKSTNRDYLARVNDPEYPKHFAATLAKNWGFDYWDGDRRVNYGGYHYKPGYWDAVAAAMVKHYELRPGDRVLDIGCGKAFLLFDLTKQVPVLEVCGLDISEYALRNCKEEMRDKVIHGNACDLPFENEEFDYVFSINTLHNLHTFELDAALREMQRVGKNKRYICIESYRNEVEKANLLYWQVTCEAFFTPDEWQWWFEMTNYSGDHSFIYFE